MENRGRSQEKDARENLLQEIEPRLGDFGEISGSKALLQTECFQEGGGVIL